MSKIIYDKLFKDSTVELSQVKVELSNINELKKSLKDGDKSLKSVRDVSTAFEEARRGLIKAIQEANGAVKRLTTISDSFASAAKSLGLKAESVKEYNEVQDKINSMKSFVSNYEKQLK